MLYLVLSKMSSRFKPTSILRGCAAPRALRAALAVPSRHLWGGAQRFLWVLCGAFLGVFHAGEQNSGMDVPTWALSPQGEGMHH